MTQQYHLLRIYPKEINKGVPEFECRAFFTRKKSRNHFSVRRELDQVRGSISYRLPPVGSSAAVTIEEDGAQISGELYGIQDDALLSEKSEDFFQNHRSPLGE